jgi:CCR4-NOT complex subunit CAF16
MLQVLAGKFMIKKEQISVLGRPPFHDTALTCDGELQYLGGSWRRDIAFAVSSPLGRTFTAFDMSPPLLAPSEKRRGRISEKCGA